MRLIPALLLVMAFVGGVESAWGQGTSYDGRPVADVRIEGLKHVNPQFVFNQIQTKAGEPYDSRVVEEDLVRIRHLNKFSKAYHLVEMQPDNSVVVIYQVVEMALLADVQVVGNTAFSDQELLNESRLTVGDPIDEFLIDRAKKAIEKKYADAGYRDVGVEEDPQLLTESRVLLLHVVEGPFLRIRRIRFQGNQVFGEKELKSKIKSRTYIFLLRKGEFSREQTSDDAALLRNFYRERGYLDAEVLREVQPSPDGKEAIVTFIIKEGEQYIVERVEIEGNNLFSDASILEAIELAPGQVYASNLRERSQQQLVDKYGELGYISTNVSVEPVFLEDRPTRVEVFISIAEGRPTTVGEITVRGNDVTQETVVLRQVQRQYPGRRYNGPGLTESEDRLSRSALFSDSRVTVLGEEDEEVRDLLVEVEEKNTGSVGLGVGISTDSGVVGGINLTQRNFDITDVPETFDEFITGRAFRGMGQYFRIDIEPGSETSRYSVTWKDPYLFESNFFLDTTGYYFSRDRDEYDEERMGGAVGLGQRFGRIWSASMQSQFEQIDITDIEEDAPLDVFDVEGDSILTSLGLSVTRSTVDSGEFPTRGSRTIVGLSRAGALGGDYNFTSLSARYNKFWTVDEDFFGRKTVLSGKVQFGYILEGDEAPIFERFYLGGQSFRGFRYRGVSPRGIYRKRTDPTVPVDPDDESTFTLKKGDDSVGGEWLFFAGTEYNFPVYQEIVRMVFFVDSGTIQEDIGLNQYRVSIGTGVRLKIPFFGEIPFALDLAYPILKEDEDDVQYFNFSLAIPF